MGFPLMGRAAGAGRPSDYTEALAQEICERIAAGDSLRMICQGPETPHMRTVWRWLDDRPEFASRYARARELQGDWMDEKILTVADACTPETAAADRVKIDAYKWRAAKLAPKKYGDRIQQEHDVSAGAAELLGALMDISKSHDAG